MSQFNPARFSRGVKLTVAHQYTPLSAVQFAAADADIEQTVENKGQTQVSWVIPWTGAAAVQNGDAAAYLPFTMPPFQQLFDRSNLNQPEYEVVLTEASLSFDQRAEALGIVGPKSASDAGLLTACDMNRYDMTLRLLERVPSLLSISATLTSGDTLSTRTVFEVEIPGVDAFGSGADGVNVIRNNPVLIQDLRIPINPFAVYVWQLNCDGLYSSSGGTIDEWSCTVGGAFVPGDTARLTIGATNYDYIVLLGDTPAMVAAGVAAVANLAGGPVLYDVISYSSDVILTRKMVGGAAAIASLFLAGVGTFVATQTQVGAVGTVEQLMLTSLNLTATFQSPLTTRDNTSDFTAPGIQNIPTAHNGLRNGTTIPLTIPANNALITGTDIQTTNHAFERELRYGAGSGYGAGYGALADQVQAANALPAELLKNDSHYHMIVVPMWCGQKRESLRGADVPSNSGLPYSTSATMDRRMLAIPDGFVLHHAFAVWNAYSPISSTNWTFFNGAFPASLTYEQEISISLNSGMRADDYLQQMVAYLSVTPTGGAAPFLNAMVDEFDPKRDNTVSQFDGYRLLQIPLVNDAVPHTANSWHGSGKPIYMGKGNSITQARTDIGILPTAFGGAAFIPPVTDGKENTLEIRWSKSNSAGLNEEPNATIVGQGGEWVILCGKLTVGA